MLAILADGSSAMLQGVMQTDDNDGVEARVFSTRYRQDVRDLTRIHLSAYLPAQLVHRNPILALAHDSHFLHALYPLALPPKRQSRSLPA